MTDALGDVPEAFSTACDAWASGRGTAADEAAVMAVSLGVPLPPEYDAAALGFDASSRLPRPQDVDAYTAVRNGARGRAHEEAALAARASVMRCAAGSGVGGTHNLSSALGRAAGTGAAAGVRDMLRAALLSDGVVWLAEAEELYPAGGASFIEALRALGLRVVPDEEQGGRIVASVSPAIGTLRALLSFWRLSAVCGDALPAGELRHTSDDPASPSALRRIAAFLADTTGPIGTSVCACASWQSRKRRRMC